MDTDDKYHELLRPQYHFTAEKNWIGDPNGLVYYKGEFHLFFQHNAEGISQELPFRWGHAVSSDLIHWRQLPHAIEPDDEFGWIWSGSAVVDWNNSGGFRTGDEDVLVAFYTSGDTRVDSYKPCVQCIAFSNDRGRTWTKYSGNPVIGHIKARNRDPKVIWHNPTNKWIMALVLENNVYVLYGSKNLVNWSHLCEVTVPGTTSCPDFFELPIDGDPSNKRWVFWGAAGVYRIGGFDGMTFTPETDSLRAEWGSNGYAAQTWSDIPEEDGRRIQISWMREGKYPYMPFNQQMSFPVELTLRSFPEGVRLCRKPIKEIELLHESSLGWEDFTLEAGKSLIPETDHDLFDIRAELELGQAEAFGLYIHGTDLRYNVADKRFTYLGREIPTDPDNGRLELQLLVDRTSLELFAFGGKVSASVCFLPKAWAAPLELYSVNGDIKLISLTVGALRGIWE